VRIIAGSARGRELLGPKSRAIRPTSDKVRGALFNILGQWMDGLSVLDLYAGTGALALEALSRGAERAVLVDLAPEALELCRKNAERLGFASKVELLKTTVERACERLGREGRHFELVFADPPYAERALGRIVSWVQKAALLTGGGILAVEHDVREQPPGEEEGGLKLTDSRKFGDTALSFFSPS